jgi:hypothetical protein
VKREVVTACPDLSGVYCQAAAVKLSGTCFHGWCANIFNPNDCKILVLTIKTKLVQFLNTRFLPTFPINMTKMKKTTFLSALLIFGLCISSLAQTKEVLSKDKIKDVKAINASTADSQKISQSIQIKPYKFNPVSLDGPRIIVIDGKVSEHGFDGIGPKDIQSLSVVKGEKATSLYGSKNASAVIIITTRRAANVTKAEKEN